METLVILLYLLSLANGNEEGMLNNQCFTELRRNIKIANCQSGHGLISIPLDLDTDIKELHFQDQLLKSLQENNFKRYGTLIELYLGNNQIKYVNDGCLRNLSELKILDLSKNIIKDLPAIFKDTPHIEEIYLNNNEIRILADNVFSNLLHLTKLHLQSNKIRSIDENCFSNVPAIYEIKLNANMIETISETIIAKLNNLKVFGLTNNPWNCDISTCKFREYSLEKNWEISMPHCDTPESVKGKIWKELKNDTVLIKANETEVEEGQDVTFTCEYLACIPFKLTWKTKQNVVLPNQTKKNSESKFVTILHLYNVAKSDAMDYVCSVEDCRDCKEEDVYLQVKDKLSEPANARPILEAILGIVIVILVVILAVIFVVILYCFRPELFNRCIKRLRKETDENSMSVQGEGPRRETDENSMSVQGEDQELLHDNELPNEENENNK